MHIFPMTFQHFKYEMVLGSHEDCFWDSVDPAEMALNDLGLRFAFAGAIGSEFLHCVQSYSSDEEVEERFLKEL